MLFLALLASLAIAAHAAPCTVFHGRTQSVGTSVNPTVVELTLQSDITYKLVVVDGAADTAASVQVDYSSGDGAPFREADVSSNGTALLVDISYVDPVSSGASALAAGALFFSRSRFSALLVTLTAATFVSARPTCIHVELQLTLPPSTTVIRINGVDFSRDDPSFAPGTQLTSAPTSQAPTSVAPSTVAPTSQAPTSVAPTTVAPTNAAQAGSPTTVAPTTLAPSTAAPTTPIPTTLAPTTAAPTTGVPTGAPSSRFDLSAYPTKEYTLDIQQWGIRADGSTAYAINNTHAFQDALDWAASEGVGRFYVPPGIYEIGEATTFNYAGGVKFKSNMAVVLDPLATIRMTPNDRWNQCLVKFIHTENAGLFGGTLFGERLQHVYEGGGSHDEGHLLCIEGSARNTVVDGVHMTHGTGDGILIVGRNPGPRDVVVRNCDINTNRRQGISLVGVVGVLIENNEIWNISGTSPQFGIDIEPLGGYNVTDVLIRSNYFHHNRGGDFVASGSCCSSSRFENNTLHQGCSRADCGADSRYIDGAIVKWPNAHVEIVGNNITMLDPSVNGFSGIIGYSRRCSDTMTREECTARNNPLTDIFHDNTCNNCGMYLYSSRNADVRRNVFGTSDTDQGYLVAQNFENLVMHDNHVRYRTACWAYRFRQVTGFSSGNTYNGAPRNLTFQPPGSDVEGEIVNCWVS